MAKKEVEWLEKKGKKNRMDFRCNAGFIHKGCLLESIRLVPADLGHSLTQSSDWRIYPVDAS